MLKGYTNYVVIVQSPRHVRLFATPGTEPPSLMSPAVAGGFFTISIVVVAVVIQLPNYV